MSRGPTWDELASVALLGTDRAGRARVAGILAGLPGPAGPVAAALDPADAPRALLDAAALLAAQAAAGAGPVPAAHAPAPGPAAPGGDRPAAGPRAATALRTVLAGAVAAPPDELLIEWLGLAAQAGLVVPPADLVGVLQRCAASAPVAVAALPVLGARGAWLAAHQPAWTAALDGARVPTGASAALAGPGGPSGRDEGGRDPALLAEAEEEWRLGAGPQRRLALARIRQADPARARELLAEGWDAEAPADRAALVDVLRHRLGPADEPLLERALDDRRKAVRTAAARLLTRLPHSAYGRRAGERALACVHLQRHLTRRRIAVLPPADCDAAMVRDGIEERPPDDGIGPRAWWLQQVVAAAPLEAWTAAWGLAPAQVVALPVDDRWRQLLVNAWAQAAIAQDATPEWAAALVDVVPRTARALLLPLLPRADREAAAARVVRTASLNRAPAGTPQVESQVTEALEACPGPWGPELTAAVLDRLARDADARTWADHQRVPLLALRLPPDAVTAVARLLDTQPPGLPWHLPLTRLRDVLALRHQMHEELR